MSIAHTGSILPSILGLQPYEWLTLLGIVIGPIAAVLITLWREAYRRQRESREQIMRLLLNTRGIPSDPSYSAAINLVPVVFNNEQKVMTAWKNYVEQVNTNPNPENQQRHNELMESKQTALIFSMLKNLNIDFPESDIKTLQYYAGGFIFRDQLYLNALGAIRELADAANRSADAAERILTVASQNNPSPPPVDTTTL